MFISNEGLAVIDVVSVQGDGRGRDGSELREGMRKRG